MKKDAKVSIIMGSDSDLGVMSGAASLLEEFGISYNITVASAHRTPSLVHKYVTESASNGVKVFIAGAGGAAHLAGVISSLTILPVVGVPIKSKGLDGLDSLLSTVGMPPGIPVATVGVDGAKNAGILAVQILAVSDKKLENKLIEYRKKMGKDIKVKGEKLSKIGYKKYLAEK